MLRSQSGVWQVLYDKHDSLFEDQVMDGASWESHRRATQRHRLQPGTLARVMLGYFSLLIWVAVLSAAVGVYDILLVQRFRAPMLNVQSVQTFFSSITFALTLLLVFKTNSSYSRWWEARKDVGQLVSFAHNLARQAVAFFPPHQLELTHALGRWTAAAMWVVKAMVRPGSPLKEELQGVLLPEELDWLMCQPHKPLALGQALSTIVQAADISQEAKMRMDSSLTLYVFEFGACGRIYNTAIPFCYTRHTSRFLLCYIYLGLPLLLWPLCRWSSPVLAVLIGFLLLGIENIGAQIEEPFHCIAFNSFCGAVTRDINNIIASAAGSAAPVVAGLTCAAGGGRGGTARVPTAAAKAAAAPAGPPPLRPLSTGTRPTGASLDSAHVHVGPFRGSRVASEQQAAMMQQQQHQGGAGRSPPVRTSGSRVCLLEEDHQE